MTNRAGWVVVALLAGAGTALADPSGAELGMPAPTADRDSKGPKHRYLWTTLEVGAALVVPGIWYWVDVDFNRADWELDWDAESWRQKLVTFEAVRFDTNSFYTNGVRHPLAGVVHYQIGRANGFGVLGSTAVNLIASVVWEYLVEFREYVSLNDIIMNVGPGVSIGEPLLQLGRFGRAASEGLTGRAFAASASPFDALNGWSSADGDRDGYWFRLELAAGLGESIFDAETRRRELALDADLELVVHPGYAREGVQDTWTAPGGWNRVALVLRLGASGEQPDEYASGIDLRTQTSLAGYFVQRVADAGDGLRGASTFVGVGAAFTYGRRRIADEWDRLAICHLAGPRLELTRYRPSHVLRWELAAYGDFAMVQAHVFGPLPRLASALPLSSALAAEGYYFARGLTMTTRAELAAGPWTAGLELRGHQMWSIDGLDRHELDDPDLDPHDIVDQRVFGRLEGALRIGGGPLSIGTVLDLALRRGTWRELDREAADLGFTTYAAWRF